MSIIHIFNGDGLASSLSPHLNEQFFLTWREILCLGPVSHAVCDSNFFSVRKQYLTEILGTTESEYIDVFQTEWEKFLKKDPVDEMVAWFGADYFCQINLMAFIAAISRSHKKDIPISLICLDTFPDVGPISCIGDLSPGQLMSLIPSRKTLTKNQMDTALRFWTIYTGEDPTLFNQFNIEEEIDPAFLSKTILNYKHLFPGKNGLNTIENEILSHIYEHRPKEKQLLRHLLTTDSNFVFGDMIYSLAIQSLMPQFVEKHRTNEESILTLTPEGVDILLHNSSNSTRNKTSAFSVLGGVDTSKFYYNAQSNEIALSN